MGLSRDVAEQYCREYPNAKTHTLSRKLYEENKKVYPTVNAARCAINKVRGKMGDRFRGIDKRNGNDALHQEAVLHSSPFEALPDPIADFSECRPYIVGGKRILVLSDIHFPFHDKEALIIALEHGRKMDVDEILLNGDILDCYALSRFVTDPRLRDFGKELAQTKAFLHLLREQFPKATIRYRRGNHELRYENWMFVKAPEILGIKEVFEMKAILGLDNLGISWHDERDYWKVGRLNIVHGHEFGRGGGVNAARWLFLKAKSTSMCGHFHRVDSHSGRDMEGKITSTWTTGCLCGLSPDYLRYNEWSHGFAYIESDGHNFAAHNHRIIDGKVY